MNKPHHPARTARRTITVGALCALAAALAACSSSSSSSSSPVAASSPTTATAASTASSCTSAASGAVTAARAEPKPYFPTTSGMAKNKGKTIWMITDSSLQIIKETAAAVQTAAAAAGMTAKVYYSSGTVADETAGIQQAINAHAGGLVIMGDPAQLTQAIGAAHAAGIPMTWFSQDTSATLPATVAGSVPDNWYADGQLIADWILADSGCNASVGILDVPVLTSSANEAKGIAAEIAAKCPSCSTYIQNVSLATLTTDIPGDVRTIMTQHPKTNYFAASYDSFVTFTDTELAQLGDTQVKVIGHDGNTANFDLIRQGKQALDIALPPVDYMGAYIVDDIGTAMTGGMPRTMPLPTRIVDSTNVGASGTDLFPSYANPVSQFTAAWDK